MRKYSVFVHEQLGYEAIKVGFSWPGFLFTWVWAFVKRLWGIGVGILIVAIILGAFLEASLAVDVLWLLLACALTFLLSLYIGLYGNDWREQSMPKRGFRSLGTFLAGSPEGAIAVAIRTEKQAAIEDGSRTSGGTKTALAPDAPPSGSSPDAARQSAAPADSAHYDRAWAEIEESNLVKATWAKAFSETGGDEAKTKARYIALRVGQLRLASASDESRSVPEHKTASTATSVETQPPATDVRPAMGRSENSKANQVRSESRSELDLSALRPAKQSRSPEAPREEKPKAAGIVPQNASEERAGRHRVFVIAAGVMLVLLLAFALAGIKYADRVAITEHRSGEVGEDQVVATTAEAEVSAPALSSVATQKAEEPREWNDAQPTAGPAPPIQAPQDNISEVRSSTSPEQLPPAKTSVSTKTRPNKEQVWERVFKPSAACIDPDNWDQYVECTNAQMRARAAFEAKWDRGEYGGG